MIDKYWVKRTGLGLVGGLLVSLTGCGGESMAPAAEMETVETGAASDWVDRQLPNPTGEVILDWAKLPDDREWGSTAGIDIGPDGHVWAYDRCGGMALAGGCEENSDRDPIFKFNKDTGEIMAQFGKGLFVLPHGIHADDDGNVWVTDSMGNETGTKGHQVFKFSPQGDILLELGKAGVPGRSPGLLNEPCDVITTPNGDIFVSDGHSGQNSDPPPGATGRILKFDKDGNFIKEWGGDGEIGVPHGLAFDSQGRLFVADRSNNRILIYDQEGTLLDTWYQFSRNSGIFIDANDMLYATDSESADFRGNGEWQRGIRIGSAETGEVMYFIPDPADANGGPLRGTSFSEGVAADAAGNIYGAEVGPRDLKKYVRRPER